MSRSQSIRKSIQCTTEPLEELINKGESLDFRLNEVVWDNIGVGDIVEYWEDFTGWQTKPTPDSRKVLAKVLHIYEAPTFTELFTTIEADQSRLQRTDELLQDLRQWWSEDREVDTGALAFHVQLINTD